MTDLLPRIEPLLLKAEALDLVEVLARLEWDHVVRRHTVDGPGKRYFNYRFGRGFLYLTTTSSPNVYCVAARKKGRSCQGVKYVFDAHTSKAGKRLNVVLLCLWRTLVKQLGGFPSTSSADFSFLYL
jgi:hypothetical protein